MGNTMNLETETTSVENATFCLLKTANANKLNASLEDSKALEYQLALIDGCVCLRISANASGGLFSKEWISLDCIEECLGKPLTPAIAFKSSMLKPVFTKGSSSNNTGFLCACLRAEGILSVSEKNLFLHLFTGDFAAWRKKLKKLGKQ
jgi:hypothetical protein